MRLNTKKMGQNRMPGSAAIWYASSSFSIVPDQRISNEQSTDLKTQRIFSYADGLSKVLYSVAFVACITSGAALPLMDLLFGKFVNKFNEFAQDGSDADAFRSALNELT
jgi:hypothetical protein